MQDRTTSLTTAIAIALIPLVAGCAGPQYGLAPPTAPASVPANAAPPLVTAASNELVGPTWQWQRTERGSNATVVAADATRYTLAFQAGGRLQLRADCNRGTAGYEVNGDVMRIGPAALTKMACPAGTQDSAFINDVVRVAAYRVTGDALTLVLADGAGSMRFTASK